MNSRHQKSTARPVQGTYAVRQQRSASRRIIDGADRLTRALLFGQSGAEQYPYTEAGRHPRPDRTVTGACPICFNSCPVTYHLANDRIATVTSVPSDPVTKGRLCPKGQFQIQMYNSPDRLTQPLKRVGKRGEGRFEPIDWDIALDQVVERLQGVRNRYHARASAIYTGTAVG